MARGIALKRLSLIPR
uniref:Uncharacterized protein n=1 Tax=Anguilla anguilla TaxID=7936 RepID=A0A0E9UYF0_ANGAN